MQAVTQDGAGFWVMTPLRTAEGTVLVNRGFVPGERAEARSRALPPPPGSAVVVGLLRASEPGGGFLRANDPASGRWYSRDVAAIARATGVEPVAPFFIDADRSAIPGYPQGGMTTVHFANNHLVYAATWFALAALSGLAAWRLANERPDR